MNIDPPYDRQGCLRNQQQNPAGKHHRMHMNRDAGQRRAEVIARRETAEYDDLHEPGDAREKQVIKPPAGNTPGHGNSNLLLR